jgi:hypothetical protein
MSNKEELRSSKRLGKAQGHQLLPLPVTICMIGGMETYKEATSLWVLSQRRAIMEYLMIFATLTLAKSKTENGKSFLTFKLMIFLFKK